MRQVKVCGQLQCCVTYLSWTLICSCACGTHPQNSKLYRVHLACIHDWRMQVTGTRYNHRKCKGQLCCRERHNPLPEPAALPAEQIQPQISGSLAWPVPVTVLLILSALATAPSLSKLAQEQHADMQANAQKQTQHQQTKLVQLDQTP